MSPVRTLLVENHDLIRLGLRSLLEQEEDFEIIGDVASAEEALHVAITSEPDVVLLELRLRGQSSIEACESIASALPDTKVIMLTSHAEDELLFAAMKAGARGYVEIRIGAQALVRAVRSAALGGARFEAALEQRAFSGARQTIRARETSAFADLSNQELRVLGLISEGRSDEEIGETLSLSQGTVRYYVSNILSKLDVTDRAEASSLALENSIEEYLD